MHEVGGFVSSRSHHKHSYYLIANSEIFGLTREETLTVALLARYHRRSMPKPRTPSTWPCRARCGWSSTSWRRSCRLADALDRGHAQQVRQVRCERREDELVIVTPGVTDLALERRAAAAKSDLFEEIYGLKVRLEEEPVEPARGGGAGVESRRDGWHGHATLRDRAEPQARSLNVGWPCHPHRAYGLSTMAKTALDAPELFINRELSWLEFNDRVLAGGPVEGRAAAGAAEVPGHRRHEPRRVLHGPRGGPGGAAGGPPAAAATSRA